MKSTGIVRPVDELGRIVIPKEFIKRFQIKNRFENKELYELYYQAVCEVESERCKNGKDKNKSDENESSELDENINNLDSFEIFDYIMLGQLQSIYIDFWNDLSHLFLAKTINGINFPQIGKRAFEKTFEEIRKARNDNAHHKPFHKTRKRRHQIIEDIELILIYIGFNLNDAINNIDF